MAALDRYLGFLAWLQSTTPPPGGNPPSFCRQNFMSETSRLRCGLRSRPITMPRHVVIWVGGWM